MFLLTYPLLWCLIHIWKSKLEYCCIVWSTKEQKYINKMEDIQRIFTSKIDGMEGLSYHQRLKKLRMYSMERRRDLFRIIYAWQQLEKMKIIMDQETNDNSSNRLINNGSYTKTALSCHQKCSIRSIRVPRGQQRRLNSIPRKLRNMTGVTLDTFKKHLDKWMWWKPEVMLCDQVMVKWWPCKKLASWCG